MQRQKGISAQPSTRPYFVILGGRGVPHAKVPLLTKTENARYEEWSREEALKMERVKMWEEATHDLEFEPF